MQTVGVIGLGIMGLPMAKRVAAAGFNVIGYNRAGQSRDRAEAEGITLAHSPRSLTEACDVIIIMVPDATAVRDVLTSPLGVVPSAAELSLSALTSGNYEFEQTYGAGKTIILCSTIDPESSKEFAQVACNKDFKFLECPVFGGPSQVENRQVILMASGDGDELNRRRPLLDSFSAEIIYVGEIGMASTLKICVNLVLLMMTFGISDASRIARAGGLDPDLIFQILERSPATNCGYFRGKRQTITQQKFDSPSFTLANTNKDSSFMLALAEQFGVPHKVLSAARGVIEKHMAAGDGEKDLTVVSRDC